MNFDHKKIEKKWQAFWKENNVFHTDINTTKEKFYALDMFPYPSGSGLHVGHPEGYTATDIISRMKKQQGYEVLHPMGFDAFGLPAEQYAIKTGSSPKDFTNKNIINFKKQLYSLGFSFDWSREVNTSDPEYYKHTQWTFIQMYKKGLAEIKEIEANWSPSLNTVLSNEEVISQPNGDLVSERDGLPVEKKLMKQWVIKITKYADKLFEGLKDLDWPEHVKKLQRNWFFEMDDQGNYDKNKLHLKDWIFARQRYWGEPFPIIHMENGEVYLIPENELPLELPEIKDYKFSQDGKPALGNAKEWSEVEINGLKGKRDLNTMPQWAGSCWYYIGYILKEGDKFLSLDDPKAKERLNKWLPVDLYIGGQEHAVLHLIYARFWHMFLFELGITNIKEPFQRLYNQGMILGPDGSKMSKSKGNIVNPNDIVDKFGADTLRVYEMFMSAFNDDKPWKEDGLLASNRWLNKVYKLFVSQITFKEPNNEIKYLYNNLIKDITNLYNDLKFNVAISKMQIFINELNKDKIINKEMAVGFLQMLSCVAPHISDELISLILNKEISSYSMKWPELIKASDIKQDITIAIQVNGKLRGVLKNPEFLNPTTDEEIIEKVALVVPTYLKDKKVKKVIYIKDKIINIIL